MGFHFTNGPVSSYEQARQADSDLFARFHRGCIRRGVFLPASPFEAAFLSTAHGPADLDFALEGAESGRQAQRRGSAVLDLLRVRHPDGGRLLLGSHGNLISLILHALEPGVDAEFHLAMPNPAIYHLEHDGRGWRVMGGHGFVQAAPRN